MCTGPGVAAAIPAAPDACAGAPEVAGAVAGTTAGWAGFGCSPPALMDGAPAAVPEAGLPPLAAVPEAASPAVPPAGVNWPVPELPVAAASGVMSTVADPGPEAWSGVVSGVPVALTIPVEAADPAGRPCAVAVPAAPEAPCSGTWSAAVVLKAAAEASVSEASTVGCPTVPATGASAASTAMSSPDTGPAANRPAKASPAAGPAPETVLACAATEAAPAGTIAVPAAPCAPGVCTEGADVPGSGPAPSIPLFRAAFRARLRASSEARALPACPRSAAGGADTWGRSPPPGRSEGPAARAFCIWTPNAASPTPAGLSLRGVVAWVPARDRSTGIIGGPRPSGASARRPAVRTGRSLRRRLLPPHRELMAALRRRRCPAAGCVGSP